MAKHESHKQKSPREKEISAFLEKIIVNAGVGKLGQQANFDKTLMQVSNDLAALSGQKPESKKAKKSIAGFKVREGQVVGLRVTLRRRKMIDFFERLITIVLPRVRDFRGLDQNFVDQGGTLNIGLREQVVFPEINPEISTLLFPLGINVVPRTKNRDEALKEYRRLGVPLSAKGGSASGGKK